METNENILEETPVVNDTPTSSVDTPTVENNGSSIEGPSVGTGDGSMIEEEGSWDDEPTEEVDVLSVLIKLALDGYEMPDILANYASFVGWDAETMKSAILTYEHDFGQFLMDEGLIDSEVEKKFLNYTMHYQIMDSLIRLGKIDFCKTVDEFNDWLVTWANTKNYQSVLDALSTIGGKEIVSTNTIEGIASADATKAILADGIVFEPGTKTNTVKGASIALNNSKIVSEINGKKGNTVYLNAKEDISVKNLVMEGDYPTNTTQLIITKPASDSEGTLNITGSTFGATGYNVINIGNSGEDSNYKEINITDCDFTCVIENNAINIYGVAENGVINIKNCTFAGSISNPIRFFNSTNVPATINIENCVFKQWESQSDRFVGVNEEYGYDYSYAYAGMLLFEDHKSGSTEAEMENKKFAKVTVNISNCTGPYGKITTPKKLSDVCGSMNKNQMIYVCYWNTVRFIDEKGKKVYNIGYTGYEDHFPKINIA